MKRLAALLLPALLPVLPLSAKGQGSTAPAVAQRVDSIFQALPKKEKDSVYYFNSSAEEANHFIRAALECRRLYDQLCRTFGDSVTALYMAGKGEKGQQGGGSYCLSERAPLLAADKSFLHYRCPRDTLRKRLGQKAFDVTRVKPIADLHRYPERYAYLAIQDDSVGHFIRYQRWYGKREFTERVERIYRLLDEKRRTIGPSHPRYALTLSDLATIYTFAYQDPEDERNDYERAIELQTEAVAIYREAGCREAYELAARHLSHLYYLLGYRRYSKWTRTSRYDYASCLQLLDWKRREIAAITPILGEATPEVLMARIELIELEERRRRQAHADAWTQLDSIYAHLSTTRQAQLRQRLNKQREMYYYLSESQFYGNQIHHLRSAMLKRQLANDLADAFGSSVCDTLFRYFTEGWTDYTNNDTTRIRPLVSKAIQYIHLDNNNSFEARLRSVTDEKTAKRYASMCRERRYTAADAQSLVDVHRYPKRYAYLAEEDETVIQCFISHDYNEALERAKALLAEKAKTVGKGHPLYAFTLNDVAVALLKSKGKASAEAAIKLQTEAKTIYHKAKQPVAEWLTTQQLSRLYREKLGSCSLGRQFHSDAQRDSIADQKRQELALIQPVLGDSAIEVIMARLELHNLENYEALNAERRHERGDDKGFAAAMTLYRSGQYAEALKRFQSIDKSEQFRYLWKRKNYTQQWLAACHLQLGDTAQAAALTTYYILPPIDRTKTLEIDYQLAFGDNYQQCLVVARDSFGDNPLEYAHMLLVISENLVRNRFYPQAISALSQAKVICRELLGEASPVYQDIALQLGAVYMGTRYYQEAALALEEVMSLLAKTVGKQSRKYQTALQRLITASSGMEDKGRMVKWTTEALEAVPNKNEDRRQKLIESCCEMVASGRTIAPTDSAAVRQAIVLGRRLADQLQWQADTAYASLQADTTYATVQEMPLYKKLIYFSKKRNHLSFLVTMTQLYSLLGQTDELKRLETACATWMRDSVGWKPISQRGAINYQIRYSDQLGISSLMFCYYRLAIIFRWTGGKELMLEASQRADEVARDEWYFRPFFEDPDIPVYTTRKFVTDIIRGLAQEANGQYEEGVQTYSMAMRLREEDAGGKRNNYYLPMRFLVNCLNKSGRHEEAADKLQEWWDYQSNVTLRQLVMLNGPQRELYWNQQKNLFESTTMQQAWLTGLPQTWGTVYDNALLTKGLLLNTEMEIERLITEDGDAAQASLYQQLRQNQLLLMGELQKPKQRRTVDTDSLQSHIRVQSYELLGGLQQAKGSDLASRLRTSWRDVAKHLGRKDVAVEFVVFPVSADSMVYAALTLRRGYERPRLTPLFTVNELKALQAADYYGSTKLYDMLWRPLADELRGCENIYFAPIGKLHQIGIEYLPGMEHYNTYRLTSTRELLNPAARRGAQHLQAALYGGLKFELSATERAQLERQADGQTATTTLRDTPDLATLRSLRGAARHMPVLEGSRREVLDIDSLMRSKRVSVATATGAAGTEESFKALSGQHRSLIHVSTHGFYQPEQPQSETDDVADAIGQFDGGQAQTQEDRSLSRSGLLMTGAADYLFGRVSDLSADDGILTAREISQLDLRGLDLVVLSACETGLGDISGEGVFGLQRGFKKAGAQTLLVSLWKVEDDATGLLMTEFYRGLLGGKSKRQAFLDAQRALRQAEGGRFDRYECWAAFVMIDALK